MEVGDRLSSVDHRIELFGMPALIFIIIEPVEFAF